MIYIISTDGTVIPKDQTVEVELSDEEADRLLEMSDSEIAQYAQDLSTATQS